MAEWENVARGLVPRHWPAGVAPKTVEAGFKPAWGGAIAGRP